MELHRTKAKKDEKVEIALREIKELDVNIEGRKEISDILIQVDKMEMILVGMYNNLYSGSKING